MPPSVITTSGSSTIVTASALSYPANADPLTYLPYDTPQLITSSGAWRHPKPGFPINLYCVLLGGGGGGGGRNTGGLGGGGGGSGYITFVELSNVIANITATIGAGGAGGAEDASGSVGGTTTFSTSTAAGGGAGTPSVGGAGAFGGGGGGTNNPGVGMNGGAGTYIGGGGGGGGVAGSVGGETTWPTIAKATLLNAGNGRVTYGGYPNGAVGNASTGAGGPGGQPWMMFPYLRTYGVGGTGGPFDPGSPGTKGCVAIFYQRPN